MKTLQISEMLLLLGIMISMVSGSMITFESTPPHIQTLLTRQLVMRCSINNTNTTTRDVITTPDNVHVTSLVITRNAGERVATITPFAPATAHVDGSNIAVSGTVAGNGGTQGYIELIWTNPTKLQGGDYRCEANAITDQGHNVVFAKDLAIDVSAPTLEALVQHVFDLQNVNANLNGKLQHLNGMVHNQEMGAQNLTHQIQTLTQQNLALQTHVHQMDLALNQSHEHIESGSVDCRNGGNWGPDGVNYYTGKVQQTFAHPYATKPIVHFSLFNLDYSINSGKDNPDYRIFLENDDNNGFTLVCRVYDHIDILNMKVNWISFPQ